MAVKRSAFTSRMIEIRTVSTMDGVTQPVGLLPASQEGPRPLLVVLHTWMGDGRQNLDGYLREAASRGWHCIQPHFRGPNRTPEACGSPLAQRDILDAMEAASARVAVDPTRIYLAGGSGGGHMAMLMAGLYPERFAAVSAWCGIADLAAWHLEDSKREGGGAYADSIEACVGGPPGSSSEVDDELVARSPLFHLRAAAGLPMDLNHGVRDGRDGSVAFWHSVWAFNELAAVHDRAPVSEAEIQQLWNDGRLTTPRPSDRVVDPLYGDHAVLLRREAGLARLTVFEGAHEAIPRAAIAWLSRFPSSAVEAEASAATDNLCHWTSAPGPGSDKIDG